MDNQQGLLCSAWNSPLLCDRLDRRGAWGRMDIYNICMTESLPGSPEIVTTFLTGYTKIQNKKFKKTQNRTSLSLWEIQEDWEQTN